MRVSQGSQLYGRQCTQQTNSTKFIPLTLTIWSEPTPHSITPTSPGGAADSTESVASVTSIGGHSTIAQCWIRVGDDPIGGGSEGQADHCEKVIGYGDHCAPTTNSKSLPQDYLAVPSRWTQHTTAKVAEAEHLESSLLAYCGLHETHPKQLFFSNDLYPPTWP